MSLSSLNEQHLRLLAYALEETQRCCNFIRLYPTPSTLRRYLPMTEARSNEDEYRAQLLTAVLYGEQLPVVQAPDEPKEELAEEEEVETLDFFHMFSIRSKTDNM